MQRVDIRDRFISLVIDESLFLLKKVIFKSIIRLFLKDLTNFDVRCKIIKNLAFTNSSLRDIYNLIK